MDHIPYITEVGSGQDAAALMASIGVAAEGIGIMAPGVPGQVAHTGDMTPQQAAVLKQEALSVGGDAALPADAYHLHGGSCRTLVLASDAQLEALADRLELHGGAFAELGAGLREAAANHRRARDGELSLPQALGRRSWLVMGVLNVTPDSFHDGGLFYSTEAAVERALDMAGEGAGIIDVGGESTRPGAAPVNGEEELSRVIPVIERLVAELEIPVSVDTYKAEVARAALDAGAVMINDVTALTGDEAMPAVAAEYACPVCLMHMQGSPRNMQQRPSYEDVVAELVDFFHRRVEAARAQGIERDNILIDPGIGFGKTLKHNLTLLNRLDAFLSLGRPLLIGASRKSFIGMVMDDMEKDRLAGTITANVRAFCKGASVFRVHDVAAHVQALEVAAAIAGEGGGRE